MMMTRKSILIVDDEEMSRELLSQMFENEYDILTAENGKEAITVLEAHMNEIAIMLLDLVMPVLNGYQVLQVLNAKKIVDRIPVVLVTAQKDTEVELSCYALGASAVISKPYVAQAVRMQVFNIIDLHKKADTLEETVDQYKKELGIQKKKLEEYNTNLLEVISNIIESRDLESGTHVKRVKGLTKIMAQTYMQLYREAGLTRKKIETIVTASVVHDIGKIAISDTILLKPGRLTDEEYEIMKSHTVKGCDILNMMNDVQDREMLDVSYEICRYHHERYDGRGYPDGLKGDEIPISAQLVSIVDVYDALVSERVYKKAFDKQTAFEMIMEGKCGIFSPKLLKCFEVSRNAIELFFDSQV